MKLDLCNHVFVYGTALLLPCTAHAQFTSDFEPPTYAASAAGEVLTGQDGWYIPAGTTSVDWLAHTYAGNALGLPANPRGGDQFAGGVGPAGNAFARAQQDVAFTTGAWRMSADVAVLFQGMLPAGQNIGSLSSQPSTGARLIMLATWTDLQTADSWNADLVYYSAAGTQVTGTIPDPAFQGLALNTWYRWTTEFDFDTNAITLISIENIDTGDVFTHEPVDFYLNGGMAGGLLPPTAVRMFAGSGTIPGNTVAFDNVVVEQISKTCYPDCTGEGTLDIFDFLCFQDAFVQMDPYADCTGEGTFDIFDFLCFQDEFVIGCP